MLTGARAKAWCLLIHADASLSLVHALHVIHHMLMSSYARAIMIGPALMGGNNVISEEELRAAPESGAIKGKPPDPLHLKGKRLGPPYVHPLYPMCLPDADSVLWSLVVWLDPSAQSAFEYTVTQYHTVEMPLATPVSRMLGSMAPGRHRRHHHGAGLHPRRVHGRASLFAHRHQ